MVCLLISTPTVDIVANVAADSDDEFHVAMEAGTAVEVRQTFTRSSRRRCTHDDNSGIRLHRCLQ